MAIQRIALRAARSHPRPTSRLSQFPSTTTKLWSHCRSRSHVERSKLVDQQQYRSLSTSLPHLHAPPSFSGDSSNRILDPIRNDSDMTTALTLSHNASQPLITLWTASFCSSCRTLTPFLHDLVAHTNFSAPVYFAELEIDAPDMKEVVERYFLTGVPMLMAFWRKEPMVKRRETDVKKIGDEKWFKQWIETELSQGPTAGGSLLSGGKI